MHNNYHVSFYNNSEYTHKMRDYMYGSMHSISFTLTRMLHDNDVMYTTTFLIIILNTELEISYSIISNRLVMVALL